ncbi:MAG: hypothetical protein JW969_12480 [Spirochaetales bacterium]|nr:hypothetical protein [Spirochaetales bacterium]
MMQDINYGRDILGTREGCNSTIKHIETMKDFIEDFEQRQNLAELLNDALAQKTIDEQQLRPMVNVLLVDKYHYAHGSFNLKKDFTEFEKAAATISRWNAVDLTCVYYHPELGVLTINPKNSLHWEKAKFLKQHEFITIYAGEYDKTDPDGKDVYEMAIKLVIDILSGKTVRPQPKLLKGKCVFRPGTVKAAAKTESRPKLNKKAVKSQAVKTKKSSVTTEDAESTDGGREMSRMYGITVTNGLFHNGNVEAWKRIIRSYEYIHPGVEIVIYYGGERIKDINSLFKWGKVKRGTVIMMAVIGENVKDLAKLRRYLEEGASADFERFIQGHPNMVLRLFG